ncbi:MAG: low molecular weight protein-tyrosine-phosphatase [Planctomycetota bacterium]
MMPDPPGVLFVCLGNICRSPLAEGIFIHKLQSHAALAAKLKIDSCGTGNWHVGNPADRRSIAVARKHGITLPSRARQFDRKGDPARFGLMLAMDRSNRDDLLANGASPDQVRLMLSFDPELASLDADSEELDVPDPYYGGPEGFDHVYSMLDRACDGLLKSISGG